MDPPGSPDAGAGGAGASRIVEQELHLIHHAGKETMLGAAEVLVKLLVGRSQSLRLDHVKTP